MAKKNNTYVTSDATGVYTKLPAAVATQGRTQVVDARTPTNTVNANATKFAYQNTPATTTPTTNNMITAPRHTWDAVDSYENSSLIKEFEELSKPKILDDGGSRSGGGGGSSNVVSTPAVSQVDPYAQMYSIYDQLKNSQMDALNQQRQARLNALQSNYNNAKSRLDSSFNAGETEMNQTADKALREAYINNMLNQRNMAQYLAGQGITGGAAESIIANLYNTYGNNRNAIEQNRADQLKELLANYQGTLGDIENSYMAGMADADSDYSGNIANALTSYYTNLANLQKENIANQYKTALGKSSGGSQSSTSKTDDTMKNLISTVKQFKSNPAYALQIIEENGYTGSDADYILQQSGIVPTDARRFVSDNVRKAVLSELERVVDNARANNVPDSAEHIVEQTMLRLVNEYGLTDEQARALLQEAGY